MELGMTCNETCMNHSALEALVEINPMRQLKMYMYKIAASLEPQMEQESRHGRWVTYVKYFVSIWILCGFFCIIFLLCLYNILIISNFNFLKYIKKIFKISTQYIFNAQQKTVPKQSVKNLDSTSYISLSIYILV